MVKTQSKKTSTKQLLKVQPTVISASKDLKTEKNSFMNRPQSNTQTSSNMVVSNQRITTNLASFVSNMSNFEYLNDDELYEQLYIFEPEIGASIDRMSTLVSESFKGMYLTGVGDKLDPKEKKCLELAKTIYEEMQVETLAETYTEVLMKHGNVMIDYRNVMAPKILPNRYITFIDDLALKNNSTVKLITDPKYLVINEMFQTVAIDEYTIPQDKYIHIKFKDTPIMQYDNIGRNTYGIFSVSPLHRCVIPIWWKRQMIIIDILHRARNVPREHHQIAAEMFSLDNYTGTSAEQHAAQIADASAFITEYVNSIKEQAVDQGYATLDNVDIKMVNGNTNHLQTNELLKQIQGDIYTGLNIPSSIVNGKDTGSYASELVVSNYVTAKVIQLAKKVRYPILRIIRDRIKLIDNSLPTDRLTIKLELVLAMNKLESFRQLALMAASGVFTEDEIRGVVAYEKLTEDQRKKIISTGKIVLGDPGDVEKQPSMPVGSLGSTANNVSADSSRGGGGKDAAYPDTPSSKGSHTRSPDEEILRT